MEIVIVCIQIIAILLLARTIQENTIEMEKHNVDLAAIKATNQRTIIIFLLMEIFSILAISKFDEVISVLRQWLSQLETR